MFFFYLGDGLIPPEILKINEHPKKQHSSGCFGVPSALVLLLEVAILRYQQAVARFPGARSDVCCKPGRTSRRRDQTGRVLCTLLRSTATVRAWAAISTGNGCFKPTYKAPPGVLLEVLQ